METFSAAALLAALAHPARLTVFRLLVQAGPEGLAAGEIARRTETLPNTLSANLSVLNHAGLVQTRREGRSVIYSAHYPAMTDLLTFLMEDCCAGSPEICAPLAAVVSQCCPAEGARV